MLLSLLLYIILIVDLLLQVQWDEAASMPRPDRVSAWEIEPLGSCPSSDVVDPVKNKKARPSIEIPWHG